MSGLILCIRPEPGASATVAAGASLGLDITAWPLFEVRPCDWQLPAPVDFDAVLAGSANAFRHGGAQLESLRHLPVHAVGHATAEAARDAGFEVVTIGQGGLQSLLDRSEAQGHSFLRLAGRDRVTLRVPTSIKVAETVVYESVACPLDEKQAKALADGGLVMLHSANAAQHFAREIDRLEIDRTAISIAALGPRIADVIGERWRSVETASTPSGAALLALVRQMCHSSG